jgi:endogenous inhibitor of DNA gyrase (YacG/DUF329 family)
VDYEHDQASFSSLPNKIFKQTPKLQNERSIMTKNCASCNKTFQAKRSSAKFCSSTCQMRLFRADQRKLVSSADQTRTERSGEIETRSPNALLPEVVKAVALAQLTDSVTGKLAFALAQRIDNSKDESASGVVALAKELRLLMAETKFHALAPLDPID